MKKFALALFLSLFVSAASAEPWSFITNNTMPTDAANPKASMVRIDMFARMSDMSCKGKYTVYFFLQTTPYVKEGIEIAADLKSFSIAAESFDLKNALIDAGFRYGVMKFNSSTLEATLEITPPEGGTFGYSRMVFYDRSDVRVGSLNLPMCFKPH